MWIWNAFKIGVGQVGGSLEQLDIILPSKVVFLKRGRNFLISGSLHGHLRFKYQKATVLSY